MRNQKKEEKKESRVKDRIGQSGGVKGRQAVVPSAVATRRGDGTLVGWFLYLLMFHG